MYVKEGIVGLAEDLKALQELRDNELSESAYAAARDAAAGKQAPVAWTERTLDSSSMTPS